MGNHEYCVDCGASDFHYGFPCDPKRLAEHQKKEREAEDREKAGIERAKKIIKFLQSLKLIKLKGWQYGIDEYGKIDIHWTDIPEDLDVRLARLKEQL